MVQEIIITVVFLYLLINQEATGQRSSMITFEEGQGLSWRGNDLVPQDTISLCTLSGKNSSLQPPHSEFLQVLWKNILLESIAEKS
jgi:hypothetical protein